MPTRPGPTTDPVVIETGRLRLRRFGAGDCEFILELLNEPAWIRYIGDRNIRTLEDAQRYLEGGPMAMVERLGFGLYLVELKETGEPIGMCGLVKRDELEDVDIGFAFLPRFWGKGYALEAAFAVMAYARTALGLSRIVAFLSQDNDRSARLLEKLGFRVEGRIALQPGGEELMLYAAA
jgi:RimJ/RimL family protein N-acetyltransferase